MDEALLMISDATSLRVAIAPSSSTAGEGLIPTGMPAAIPADQAYYWSFAWQDDVRESMDALARGDFEEFDSDDPNDVVRWFLSDDDD